MKTAAEWWRKYPPRQAYEWIEMIQSDARAGMVPAAELHGDRGDGHCQACIGRSVKAEAELAKAWEAGRTDAADAAGTAQCLCLENIRALQPPGGRERTFTVPAADAELYKKGWRDGRDACVTACKGATYWAECVVRIRALQPPGGKAK